jgi:hypothetical protein
MELLFVSTIISSKSDLSNKLKYLFDELCCDIGICKTIFFPTAETVKYESDDELSFIDVFDGLILLKIFNTSICEFTDNTFEIIKLYIVY